MPTPDPLLARVEKHLKAAGLAPARFGLDAMGDPNLVRDLRAGREPRRSTAARILAAIEAHGASTPEAAK